MLLLSGLQKDERQNTVTTSKLKCCVTTRISDLWISIMLKKKLHQVLSPKETCKAQRCRRPFRIKMPLLGHQAALYLLPKGAVCKNGQNLDKHE